MSAIKNWLLQKKTYLMIAGLVATAAAMWAEDQLSLGQFLSMLFGGGTAAALKAGDNRKENALKSLSDKIRKLAGVVVLFGALSIGAVGCCSDQVQTELKHLKELHSGYRTLVVPKPSLSAADKDKVNQLADEINKSFDLLLELTD